MEILTPPEIRRLLDAADEPVRTLLLCAVLTGMRRGELLGLKWEDVDPEGSRIHVRRSLWRGKLITHRLPLDDAPRGCAMFNKEDDCIKIVLKP